LTARTSSPQAVAAAMSSALVGSGTALTVMGMVILHSDPLVATGVGVLVIAQFFVLRSLKR